MENFDSILPILKQVGITNSEDAINFADQYLGGSLRNILYRFSDMIDDNIRLWQFKNQVKIALKAKEYCNSKGIDNPRKLENCIIIPLIEDAKNIEDDHLVELFSGLLANYLDPNSYKLVHPSYSKIISELSPLDAQIINELYHTINRDGLNYQKSGSGLEYTMQHFSINKEVALIAYQNLWRLNIFDRGGSLDIINQSDKIFFTEFGWSMMKSCLI